MMRLGPADVSTLAPYCRPHFDDGAMLALPDFHAVACMSDHNRPIPPFVLKAHLATPDPARHVPVSDLVELSRQRYCVPIEQANQELSKLFNLDLGSLGQKSESRPVKMAGVLPVGAAAQTGDALAPHTSGAAAVAAARALACLP